MSCEPLDGVSWRIERSHTNTHTMHKHSDGSVRWCQCAQLTTHFSVQLSDATQCRNSFGDTMLSETNTAHLWRTGCASTDLIRSNAEAALNERCLRGSDGSHHSCLPCSSYLIGELLSPSTYTHAHTTLTVPCALSLASHSTSPQCSRECLHMDTHRNSALLLSLSSFYCSLALVFVVRRHKVF